MCVYVGYSDCLFKKRGNAFEWTWCGAKLIFFSFYDRLYVKSLSLWRASFLLPRGSRSKKCLTDGGPRLDPRPPFKPGNRSSLAVGGAWFSSFLAVFLFAVSASVSATLWICLWLEACECCNEYYMLLYDFYILRAVQMFTSCLNSWYQ